MTDLILYTNPLSRGRIARWMVEETGAPYKAEIIRFGPPMKEPGYRAVNPMGKVPAIRHGDKVVTEAAAICAYLADAFPEAGLAPPPAERASYYRWLFFASGPLEQAVTIRALGFDVPADKHRMVGYGSYEEVMDTLEQAVEANPFIAGDTFSAADVYVCSHIGWGMHTGDVEKRQAFIDYVSRVGNRPAAARAMALDDEAARSLQPDGS